MFGTIAFFISERIAESTRDMNIFNNNNSRTNKNGSLKFSLKSVGFRVYRLIVKVSLDKLKLIVYRLRHNLFDQIKQILILVSNNCKTEELHT